MRKLFFYIDVAWEKIAVAWENISFSPLHLTDIVDHVSLILVWRNTFYFDLQESSIQRPPPLSASKKPDSYGRGGSEETIFIAVTNTFYFDLQVYVDRN